MAKSENQKLKLLYLARYFQEQTDETHSVTIADLIAYLASCDIRAERKSLYNDIAALQQFGMDILQSGGHYHLASRDFELPELKLLVDAVQSSKFITGKKTLALIKKLERLASVHEAQRLQREVYVSNRVKSMNESVYYNVDEISGAMQQNREIRFQYFEYTLRKERRYRRDGAFYVTSPYALLFEDGNYYLLGWDEPTQQMRHYRVDKMSAITPRRRARQGGEIFAKMNMSTYNQMVFGMFAGTPQQVCLRFASHLAGAVIDRFGKDIPFVVEDAEHFLVSPAVVVSPQFFGWLAGFGTEAELLRPQSVREQWCDFLRGTLALYTQPGDDVQA